MIRLNLFMIWFLHFLSLLSVICMYYRQNSLSRIIVVLVYTVSTPLLYILAGITIIRSSNGNPGDAHLQNDMIHAGQLIERTLHEQGRTVTWFASQLCCTRPNVYKIFRKENIDIHLLWRISCILGHDFFRDLSDSINTGNFPSVSK